MLITSPKTAKGTQEDADDEIPDDSPQERPSVAVCRSNLLIVEAHCIEVGVVAVDGLDDGVLDFLRSLSEHVRHVRLIAEIHLDRPVGDESERDRSSVRQGPLLLPVGVVRRRTPEAALDVGGQRPHRIPIRGILGGSRSNVVPDVLVEVERRSDVDPHFGAEGCLVVVVDPRGDDLDPLHAAGSRTECDPGRPGLDPRNRRIVDRNPFGEDHHQIPLAECFVGRAEHLVVAGGSLVLRLVGRNCAHKIHPLLGQGVPPDHVAGDESGHTIEGVRLDECVCETAEVIRDPELWTGRGFAVDLANLNAPVDETNCKAGSVLQESFATTERDRYPVRRHPFSLSAGSHGTQGPSWWSTTRSAT